MGRDRPGRESSGAARHAGEGPFRRGESPRALYMQRAGAPTASRAFPGPRPVDWARTTATQLLRPPRDGGAWFDGRRRERHPWRQSSRAQKCVEVVCKVSGLVGRAERSQRRLSAPLDACCQQDAWQVQRRQFNPRRSALKPWAQRSCSPPRALPAALAGAPVFCRDVPTISVFNFHSCHSTRIKCLPSMLRAP